MSMAHMSAMSRCSARLQRAEGTLQLGVAICAFVGPARTVACSAPAQACAPGLPCTGPPLLLVCAPCFPCYVDVIGKPRRRFPGAKWALHQALDCVLPLMRGGG